VAALPAQRHTIDQKCRVTNISVLPYVIEQVDTKWTLLHVGWPFKKNFPDAEFCIPEAAESQVAI
jgi:hypothetical protein